MRVVQYYYFSVQVLWQTYYVQIVETSNLKFWIVAMF